jgi:hypothetical protein
MRPSSRSPSASRTLPSFTSAILTRYVLSRLSYILEGVVVPNLAQVPDFNAMYELYDPCAIMFFFRNKHIMCDFGTGNNNKLNWVLEDKQELIDIIETVYRGAKKGRGLVVSPKDYSTRHKY